MLAIAGGILLAFFILIVLLFFGGTLARLAIVGIQLVLAGALVLAWVVLFF